MKNSNFIDLKIIIYSKDNTNFLELAIFFDKPEFLQGKIIFG